MVREAARALALSGLGCVLAACGGRTGLDVSPASSPGDLQPDVCVELPPREPPEFVDVSFNPRIEVADVLILVDTTISMDSTLRTLQYALRHSLIPDLLANVPDVRLGVASFRDFDWSHDGTRPFQLDQRMTTDRGRLEAAVDRLEADGGVDAPEAQLEALYQVATGIGHRGAHVPAAHCPRHTVGYPCFREFGARLILLITDSYFHGGPTIGASYPEGRFTPEPATYDEAVEALNGIGAKVIGLFTGGAGETADAIEDLRGVARDTGTVTSDGEPIVFDIGGSGRGLSEGVSESVRQVVEQVPIDVDLVLEAVSSDFDPELFVSSIQAVDASPASGALMEADSFRGVRPGTRVHFRLELRNESIPRASEDRRFYLRAILRGDHATRLQETLIEIVVPGADGLGCEA